VALFTLQDISVAYNKQNILKDFNLEIEKGKLVSLLGPSGCGKTTTLRLIAGFLQANEGKFLFKEKDYTKVPVNKRNFGFVFQNYALFPQSGILALCSKTMHYFRICRYSIILHSVSV
jgi:putative spermidine/putrescine transport system ATP-binding protein